MSQNHGPPFLPWTLASSKGSGYIGKVGCTVVPYTNLWKVGDIPQTELRSHHVQTYSLYETYGDISKDCTITREQKT